MRAAYVVIFGILLPCVALGFELCNGASAEIYFDPIPTLWHVLLVALVPVANFLVLMSIWKGWCPRRLLAWLNGIAMGVALVYTAVYLPLTPFAFLAIAALGIGLLPLSPLLSLIAALVLRGMLGQASEKGATEPGQARPLGARSLVLGAALGVVALLIPEVPAAVTLMAVHMSSSKSPEVRERGLSLLRSWGSDACLLDMCYGRTGRSFQMISPFANLLTPGEAQKLYFRVTGRPFNSMTPPRHAWHVLARDDDFDFDPDLGGQVVAGRRKGLSLVSSRLDATVAPGEASGYLEWTMVFRNDHWREREARAQILLPPGGVVSRLTLWVNSEPREAAFAGTGKVRDAYRKVAVEQRRDPVLVTWAGVDRVLVQCFPVPPGGEMKVRLGITTPLELNPAAEARFHLPWLLERNFGMTEEGLHAVWIESAGPLAPAGPLLRPERTPDGRHVLTAKLTDAELNCVSSAVDVPRAKDSGQAWTKDPRDEKQVIVEQLAEVAQEPPDRIVVVVDGSAAMAGHLGAVGAALSRLPPGIDAQMLVAADRTIDLSEALADRGSGRLGECLRQVAGRGGCDNVDPLVEAYRRAAEARRGVVLWIHGPMPVVLEPLDPLLQRLERQQGKTRICDLQLGNGPNRVAEAPEALGSMQTVRCGATAEELGGAIARLTATRRIEARRTRAAAGDKRSTPEGSGHLARLWARDRVFQIFPQGPGKRKEATELAIRYQIVTPVSGAVVLETDRQYKETGLEPVDPDSVPTIPEPETWVLLAVVLAVLAFEAIRRGRRWRSA